MDMILELNIHYISDAEEYNAFDQSQLEVDLLQATILEESIAVIAKKRKVVN